MISGEFNSNGELVFEIGFVTADEDIISVNAILDTGFTGWLVINNQDALSLGWRSEYRQQYMQTAMGEEEFNLYQGKIMIDGDEFTIPVLGGDEIENILLGVYWLQLKRLVVDFQAGILTLE